MLTEKRGGKFAHKKYLAPWKREQLVPRGTQNVTLAERYFCQSIRPETGTASVQLALSPEDAVAVETVLEVAELAAERAPYELSIYFGPRDYFRLQQAGFKDAFPVGMLGQIGLILLQILSFIAKITRNYGVAIIILSGLITCLTAPFTLMSVKSMKRMQELKPKMDAIMAKYKGDPTRANKEVFALYKEHKVSPLGGCLPMFLQMPIFIALFYAISHYIELRGESFLWIKDLSMPDRIATLPFSIPFLGDSLNLLPIIMAVVMYVQTKMSSGGMPQSQSNPTAKMMSGPLMPVLFGVMFYQFQSGLVLYWLTNSLFSLLWYRLAK